MDEETFLLLMQLMFGDHDQRQQANFRLRRKEVPDKLRLECQHKGPGARQSLQKALHDAMNKCEFTQRTQQYTAQPHSTRTDINYNFVY